ncbi:effector-associated domain 2-containing protein [Haliangium sp.]|uniref:effector-associated domain 2-containing protein n=1 Tax=Haliangium sp. TaxID=2663208 RepID=UPI003D14C3C0
MPSGSIDQQQQDQLVELLLACRTMADKAWRDELVHRLGDLAAQVTRSDTPRLDLIRIVRVCVGYEHGLRRLAAAMRVVEGDSDAARALHAWLDLRAPAQPPPGANLGPGAPAACQRTATWLRLTLDRHLAWDKIANECQRSDDHLLFLVHGAKNQNLRGFLERLRYYCHTEERLRGHFLTEPIAVHRDGTVPTTVGMWQERLTMALGGLGLPAPDALAAAAREKPRILLFDEPVRAASRRARSGFHDRAQEALLVLVEKYLPQWIAEAAAACPLRVVLAVEHPKARSDALTDRIEAALAQAPRRHEQVGSARPPGARATTAAGRRLRFVDPIPITFPDWAHVEADFKREFRPLLTAAPTPTASVHEAWKHLLDDAERVFTKHARTRHFEKLALALHEVVESHLEQHPPDAASP